MDDLICKEPKGYYFESYSEVGSHISMIEDYNRTIASSFQDQVVLDVGCGLGNLSLSAAEAGAKKVIGVDASNVCDLAKQRYH